MSPLELVLYKTRKSVLEGLVEIGDNNVSSGDITLSQCNSCGVWLKPSQMLKDLDGLDICNYCHAAYGL